MQDGIHVLNRWIGVKYGELNKSPRRNSDQRTRTAGEADGMAKGKNRADTGLGITVVKL